MARASALTTLCVLAVSCCLALQCAQAFLPAPAGAQIPRGDATAAAAAAGAAASTLLPGAAGAFYYDGKEYFDITFGIPPLSWGIAAFAIITYGAVLKNAALKYNKPFGTTTLSDPKPEKTGKYVGSEVEYDAPGYKV
eukprot:CAMPEP_0204608344 /NCGR_PEP_ID=MMETSP0661-20131031/60259_1 /ASSEMBLY_ACC=CAM_ASM_000606 /TAXON_ID=109239 /ORGANISM="Alexandrium margalefi, Strain AMGDE01CS-322" /LENGTH=137 /DNA_ID=CAMNT_0051619849 /DNA_START=60 /DNA_END=473 /DNA_ORIENTATION=+